MIETYLLHQLMAFVKYNTLSEAAVHLHISQSALSRSMKKIEQTIGVELFVRKKNSIALNDNGKLFVELAQNILAQIQDSVEKVREFDKKNRTIFIGACAPLPLNQITFLLNQNFPETSISSELNIDEYILRGLQNDSFDVAILHECPDSAEFFSRRCGTEKLFLCVPFNHKFADKDGIFLEELNGEKVLLYSKIGFWHELCKQKAPHAKFLLQNEREVFTELVNSSVFLSFTTDFFIDNGRAQKNCLYKPIFDKEADITYYCVCKIKNVNRFKFLFKFLKSTASEKKFPASYIV